MLSLSIKEDLQQACRHYAEQRLATARQAMDHAQEAANEEGKSSAGDKYETGRAMAQIERDKAAQQAHEAQKLLQIINQLNPALHHDKVAAGSVVVTTAHTFYLAVGIGKLLVSGTEFLVLAPASPLGKSLLGLAVNDAFTFNNQRYTILQIL
ncbi:3-oxoacyl-ACP synthase [Chryseolinea lacunae]|uniref:3-oxoacyl-ACP synthase n=1 Tax=Chryseolinea lacunae TaxID=2801331 RepID=A0ABS1L107_9BACT|nr:3-oxoacyl-ACP synthase [Chryseolinea lacunae]MBL0745375.1 3-oxoacyl-ACP synthase [Chryseolinea lacunae]